MKANHLLLPCIILLIFSSAANGQYLRQYFDGNDTAAYAVIMHTDTNNHVWQIGRPQKTIFNSAATVPNALVTDTINTYPANDSSYISFGFKFYWGSGIIALQWKQKLDFDKRFDGGIIEYSKDTGRTWHNVFNDPYVYSFYGFNATNKDTLASGEYAFSGTDTTWRDIWLCFRSSFLPTGDSALFRFRISSDAIDSAKEGWLIDNFMIRPTMIHTAASTIKEKEDVIIYPTVTSGMVNIVVKKQGQLDKIDDITLVASDGRVVRDFGANELQCSLDLSMYPQGDYFLKIKTSVKAVTMPVVIKR